MKPYTVIPHSYAPGCQLFDETRGFVAQSVPDDLAPLFANAPAMLAALKVARAEIHNPGAFRSHTTDDIAEYLDAAIDSAEGR